MCEHVLWSIGSADGRSEQLIDNYKQPGIVEDVLWNVSDGDEQQWPLFHPSEADPDSGYRLHPYTIRFDLGHKPEGAYALTIHYLVIAPRLSFIELKINGTEGRGFLKPIPSTSGEIRFHSGLHTSIYSQGVCRVVIPAEPDG